MTSSFEVKCDTDSRGMLLLTVVSCVSLLTLAVLNQMTDTSIVRLLFLFNQAVVVSLVIWQACDPFADAAQWLGDSFCLPGSVRGATLDAVASSMPELFSGIFFVILVGSWGADSSVAELRGEGFGATIATCAGSAVYNAVLIPAICAVFISYYRQERPTIDVERKVLSRDGVWFVYCEIILIVFLFQPTLHWWMAVVLLGLYVVYLVKLYGDAQEHRDHRVLRDAPRQSIDRASAFFGRIDIRLTTGTAWTIISISTLVAAVACYWLVEVTLAVAELLHVPLFFVAVILAAAASSVPDTLLSVGAAKRGDDDGAVSNAFGSNIFDICVCLAVPLLVASYLNGWGPISLTANGEPLPGLLGLRVILCLLTLATLAIMWHRRQLNRTKGWALCGMYGLFLAYAVVGSLQTALS